MHTVLKKAIEEVRVIDPAKLKAKRGSRSRAAIVEAGKYNGAKTFSEQDLYNWEKGNNAPENGKVPFLLVALGVKLDDVTSPVAIDLK